MAFSDRTIFTVRFNWGYILTFVFMWSYGYYNTPLPGKNSVNTLILTGILFLILIYAKKFRHICADSFIFQGRDLLMVLLLAIVVGAFSFRELNNALVGDDLYHAKAAQFHAIALADFLFNIFPGLGAFQHRHILQFSNVLILLILVALIFVFSKIKSSYRIPALIAVFFLARLLFAKLGIFNHDSHPPFRLFPLWLTSTLLPLSDFSFRIAQTAGIFVLGLFVFRRLSQGNGFFVSAITAVSIVTIPVYWHVAEIVEQSIWTSTMWTILAVILVLQPSHTIHWVRLSALISIFSLMRSSAFAAIPAFGFFLFISRPWTGWKISARDIAVRTAPFLVFIPFTLKSIIEGTPAIDKTLKLGDTLLLSFQNGQSLRYIYYNITQPWLIMPVFLFSLLNKRILRFLIILVLFAAGYVIFYSIRPDIWGMGRYQAEYALPFCVAGFISLHVILAKKSAGRTIFAFFALGVAVFNIDTYMNLPRYSKPRDQWNGYFSEIKTGGVRIMSDGEGIFNYREALSEIRNAGFAGSTFICGVTYGSFVETLSGYSTNEVKKADIIYSELNIWAGYNTEKIHNNPKVRATLFVECSNPDAEIVKLEALGWKRWREFRNERYGSVIRSAIRN